MPWLREFTFSLQTTALFTEALHAASVFLVKILVQESRNADNLKILKRRIETMNKRIAIIVGIAAMLVCGAILVTAQSGTGAQRAPQQAGIKPPPPSPPPPPPFGLPPLEHLTRELNLTEAQQAEIKAFMDAERTTLENLMTKLDAERRQLDEATKGGQFDEAQVRALAAQQAQTFTELIVEHKRVEARLYSLLTPEQRTRFEQLRQRRQPPPPPPPPSPDE
jgi:Spy/CpxP family protein refolding chaperone